jgi:uncharacterized protein YbaA (DUF1428 family)
MKATFATSYTFTPLAVFIVPSIGIYAAMENKTESGRELEETGNYLGLNFVRAPKRNHDAIAQIGIPLVQWFKKHGVKPEVYHLSSTTKSDQNEDTLPPEGLESVTKKLSVGEDDELWVLLQFYRDQAHANEVYSKMMQDENIGQLVEEFDSLVTQGSNLIMGGFSRLRV